MRPLILVIFLASAIATQTAAAQVTTVCSLYGNTAQCTSYDNGSVAAEQQREAYQTGQAIGRSAGLAIFRAHFPGWRRKYCSKHPGQPFVYANAAGDSISGTCPTAEGLANEVAAEWCAKHSDYQATPANGQTMVAYIGEHHLSFVDRKSYDEAYRYLKANGPQSVNQPATSMPSGSRSIDQPATSSAMPSDLFVWFDEPAPAPGAPLFEVVVTGRAYDGALAILRNARQGNTSVQAGRSVLDTNYHPSTMSLSSWQESNPNSVPSLFYWQGEEVSGTTLVMHLQMTKRA